MGHRGRTDQGGGRLCVGGSRGSSACPGAGASCRGADLVDFLFTPDFAVEDESFVKAIERDPSPLDPVEVRERLQAAPSKRLCSRPRFCSSPTDRGRKLGRFKHHPDAALGRTVGRRFSSRRGAGRRPDARATRRGDRATSVSRSLRSRRLRLQLGTGPQSGPRSSEAGDSSRSGVVRSGTPRSRCSLPNRGPCLRLAVQSGGG